MAVPGNAPADLAATELFAVDAYAPSSTPRVARSTRAGGRVRLRPHGVLPDGGGQPYDLGTIETPGGTWPSPAYAARPARSGTPSRATCPTPAPRCTGAIDWTRRHQLMRTHTALHILCGVIWADYAIPVTGGNMEPLKGRLDFPFPAMSADLGRAVERRINDEIERPHEIVVDFLPRSLADADPALIRTAPT